MTRAAGQRGSGLGASSAEIFGNKQSPEPRWRLRLHGASRRTLRGANGFPWWVVTAALLVFAAGIVVVTELGRPRAVLALPS